MNKVAAISLAGAGGLLLFSVAYIGFAKMNHAPLHTLPVFGSLFPKPPEDGGSHGDTPTDEHGDEGSGEHASANGSATPTDEHASTTETPRDTDAHASGSAGHAPAKSGEPREAKADLLGMFQFESPYSADEIRELVDTLERKNKELDRRLMELSTKEELVDDRLEAIEDRQQALDTMKSELEELQSELAARAEEVQRDGLKKVEEEQKTVKALAVLFEDGEADALASRLIGYGPKEAAKILATLPPDRAKELLDALPQAKWREFAEVYTKTVAALKTK